MVLSQLILRLVHPMEFKVTQTISWCLIRMARHLKSFIIRKVWWRSLSPQICSHSLLFQSTPTICCLTTGLANKIYWRWVHRRCKRQATESNYRTVWVLLRLPPPSVNLDSPWTVTCGHLAHQISLWGVLTMTEASCIMWIPGFMLSNREAGTSKW